MKEAIPQCKNTPLKVKTMYSNSELIFNSIMYLKYQKYYLLCRKLAFLLNIILDMY